MAGHHPGQQGPVGAVPPGQGEGDDEARDATDERQDDDRAEPEVLLELDHADVAQSADERRHRQHEHDDDDARLAVEDGGRGSEHRDDRGVGEADDDIERPCAVPPCAVPRASLDQRHFEAEGGDASRAPMTTVPIATSPKSAGTSSRARNRTLTSPIARSARRRPTIQRGASRHPAFDVDEVNRHSTSRDPGSGTPVRPAPRTAGRARAAPRP